MFGFLVLSIILSVLWCILQNSVTPQNLVVGFVLGAILTLALRETVRWRLKARDVFSIKKAYNLVNYLLHLGLEIVAANINVTGLILNPKSKIRPGILEVPLDVEGDVSVTAFANSITLTPGTITMVVSGDQKALYVHTLDIEEPQQSKNEMKDCLEKYILRLSE
jgi:multicomponent Na+:H+ antiporter subunit E